MKEFKDKDSFKITEAIRNNSDRGIAFLEKQKAPVSETLKKFNEVIHKDNLSIDDVKNLYVFLNKSQKDYSPLNRTPDGTPDIKSSEYLAAGGSCALAWTRLILREENILKSFQKEITEKELNSEEDLVGIKLPITKSLNEEKRLATFLVLEPQDDDMLTSDLHGDWYDADTVEKSCYNFNRLCRKSWFLHMMPVSTFEFVESYITKTDSIMDGKFIKKGSWLATIWVDESEEGEYIWQGIKSGNFNGLSIQCMAHTESIDD